MNRPLADALPVAALNAALDAALPVGIAVQRRMVFGCPSVFFNGHMVASAHRLGVVLRLADDDRTRLLGKRGARAFEPMPGRPMRDLVVLEAPLAADPTLLARWVGRAFDHVRTLAPRAAAAGPRSAPSGPTSSPGPTQAPAAAPAPRRPPRRPAHSDTIETLPGLGPASRTMLAAAGIGTAARLRELGAVRAFVLVERSGATPSLNLLWALEGALTGVRWQDVARRHRTSLLLALDGVRAAAGR